MCAMSVKGPTGWKRESDPLELQLQTVISCLVVMGNEPGSSARALTSVLNH